MLVQQPNHVEPLLGADQRATLALDVADVDEALDDGSARRRCADGKDDVRLKADQLEGESGKHLVLFVRIALLEGDVPPLDIAEIPQPLRKRLKGCRPEQRAFVRQDAYSRDLRRLLRMG